MPGRPYLSSGARVLRARHATRMKVYAAAEVLEFWFPQPRPKDHAAMVVQQEWWFRGGADAQILARFVPLHTAAARASSTDGRGRRADGWR